MRLSKNFILKEFLSKDGAITPPEAINNLIMLASNLQIIRDHIQTPIIVNSGYRSPDHNKKIGGAKNSYHMKGMASDIVAPGFTPEQLFDIIVRLMNTGKIKKGGIKQYSTFVHYDIRGTKTLF